MKMNGVFFQNGQRFQVLGFTQAELVSRAESIFS